jgi:hypothetical protein
MYNNYSEDYLMHYGVKGMKWGVRRYQKKDGTLTAKGKKRLSKDYKKLVDKAKEEVTKNATNRYVNAHNKTADEMNNGLIDKYNSDYKKKLGSKAKGHDYLNDEEYNKGYEKLYSDRLVKHYNKALVNEIETNANYKKAKELCDQYGMTKFDDFARDNQAEIDEIRRSIG